MHSIRTTKKCTMRKHSFGYNHKHKLTIDNNLPHLAELVHTHTYTKPMKMFNFASLLHHHKHSIIIFHVLYVFIHVNSFFSGYC